MGGARLTLTRLSRSAFALGVVVAITSSAFAFARPASAQSSTAPLSERVTLAFGDSAGGCVVLPDSVARRRPGLTILSPPTDTTNGGDGKVFRGARVGVRRMTCRSGDAGYALEGVRLEPPFSYLVVLGAAGPAQLKRDRIDIDLTGDGKPESVRVCASQEGEHFTIWSGPTLSSKRLAHQYASLGYDVEPNCRPAEYDHLLRQRRHAETARGGRT